MTAAEPYTVRHSKRARRLRIQVTAEAVEVVVPRGMEQGVVDSFVESRTEWIERTQRRMRARTAVGPPTRVEDGGEVPYLGERLTLRVRVDPRRARPRAARRGDVLEVELSEEGEEALRAAVERWYRDEARREVAWRLDAAVARVGASYARLQIRGQRTRWASCSARGTMSFNWRLLLAPPAILDYVVEHEVAHLEVHDHSPRFWSLLERRCPEYREHEAWLRANGHALRL